MKASGLLLVGTLVPASRYVPGPRRRPAVLPEMLYAEGGLLRKVDQSGRIS